MLEQWEPAAGERLKRRLSAALCLKTLLKIAAAGLKGLLQPPPARAAVVGESEAEALVAEAAAVACQPPASLETGSASLVGC